MRFLKQGLDHELGFLIRAFAEMLMADFSIHVYQIMRRPILVFVCIPDCVFIIHRDRISDAQIVDRLLDIVRIFFKSKLRRMHADDHQSLLAIFFIPGFQVRQGAQTVDARVCPEIHQHHLAAQHLASQWRRVEPLRRSTQGRHRSSFGDDGCAGLARRKWLGQLRNQFLLGAGGA